VPRLPHPGDSPDADTHPLGPPATKPARRRDPGRAGRWSDDGRGTGRSPGARRPRR
jgi:hypothetical protein